MDTLDSKKTFKHWTPVKDSNKVYFLKSKLEAKLLFSLRIGELNFKTNRRVESERKFGGTDCWTKVCLGKDDLHHVMECFGYETRLKKNGVSGDDMAEYLKKLHVERLKKHNQPLVYMRL